MEENLQYEDLRIGSTNRGVTDTVQTATNAGASSLAAILDWVEFTVWNKSVQEVAEEILGFSAEDFFHTELYANGYRDSYQLTSNHNITIATNGIPEQGVHVTITGTGCRLLFSMQSPEIFVECVLNNWGKFSRVDLALDDYTTQWYSVHELIKHLQKNELICRWKTYHIYQGGHIAKGSPGEETLYLGSAKSECFLKIYNKTLEQKQKLRDAEALSALPEHWTRWEFCCRHKKANALMKLLLEKQFALGEVFAGLLNDSMRICKTDGGKNRSRWPMQRKWKRFIGVVTPLRLYVEKPEASLERKKEWLRNQVGPTLAAVLKTKDGFAYILEMAAKADAKLDGRMEKMVEVYNNSVKDDESVENLVHKSCVPYVLELQNRCFLEGPPPEDTESA
ncbi:MAG: replication initiation factor domain-containing protein [Peptococcaceae bacterium]|nr:replication initiation factor domain-containing protein [Peptococcaceae bacterium]